MFCAAVCVFCGFLRKTPHTHGKCFLFCYQGERGRGNSLCILWLWSVQQSVNACKVCVCDAGSAWWPPLSLSLSRGGEGVSVTGCSDSWSTADRIYQTQPRPWSVPACNSAVCLPHLASRNGLDAARFCTFCDIISDSDVCTTRRLYEQNHFLQSARDFALNVCCIQRPSREFCVFKGLTTEKVLSPNSRLTD